MLRNTHKAQNINNNAHRVATPIKRSKITRCITLHHLIDTPGSLKKIELLLQENRKLLFKENGLGHNPLFYALRTSVIDKNNKIDFLIDKMKQCGANTESVIPTIKNAILFFLQKAAVRKAYSSFFNDVENLPKIKTFFLNVATRHQLGNALIRFIHDEFELNPARIEALTKMHHAAEMASPVIFKKRCIEMPEAMKTNVNKRQRDDADMMDVDRSLNCSA